MRIRTVKPDFFLHEDLFRVEKAARLPVRLAFVGLWCAADREGRFRWQPARLKVQILPYDSVDFAAIMDALHSAGFILRYGKDGEFGLIPSFLSHQHVNIREAQSTLPAPDSTCMHVQARVEGKGREGKGRECPIGHIGAGAPVFAVQNASKGEKPTAKMPPTSAELDLLGAKIGLPPTEVRKFESYYQSNGWRVGRNPMKSVAGAMAGWKTRWQERGGATQPRPASSAPSASVLAIAQQNRLDTIERRLAEIEGNASQTATEKVYDEGEAMERQDLIAERAELRRKLREITR